MYLLQLSDLHHPLIVTTLCCRDTVKLTAMFVAKNGTSFLDKLMMREQVSQPHLCLLFPTYVHGLLFSNCLSTVAIFTQLDNFYDIFEMQISFMPNIFYSWRAEKSYNKTWPSWVTAATGKTLESSWTPSLSFEMI